MSKTDSLASEHVWKRIEQLHCQKIEIQQSLSRSEGMVVSLSSSVIKKGVEQIRAAFDKRYDRKIANTALRKMFKEVVVDIRKGELRFIWKDGDTLIISISPPSTIERQRANAYRASRDRRGWFRKGIEVIHSSVNT